MAATLISVKSDVPAGVRTAGSQPAFSDHPLLAERPSLLKQALGVFLRYLIAIGIGIGGTLAWQTYGADAKQMVANWVAQRGWPVTWLSGETAKADPASGAPMTPTSQAAVQPASANMEAVAPIGPETMAQTARLERLEAISADFSAMRERIEQMAAGQEQMASDIAKLKTAEQEMRQKISTAAPRPAAALPSKPRVPSSPPLPQPMPLH